MTGFRVVSPVLEVIAGLKVNPAAADFAPEVRRFLSRSLTTAIQLTPALSLGTIRAAQRKQYANRINYIPSVHDLIDPTLIVKSDGTQWLYTGNKWYRPDMWKLSDDVWNTYMSLLNERDRRLETNESDFIEDRAQARFLYKKSWWQIGQSAGVSVQASSAVKDAFSRHNPPKDPPKGYAQIRGGKTAYSIVVYNPFLEQESRYKRFSGKAILAEAMAQHQAQFEAEVLERQTKAILKVLEAL